MYNYICDICGAYLDPGERCSCHDTHEKNLRMVDELLEPDTTAGKQPRRKKSRSRAVIHADVVCMTGM